MRSTGQEVVYRKLERETNMGIVVCVSTAPGEDKGKGRTFPRSTHLAVESTSKQAGITG